MEQFNNCAMAVDVAAYAIENVAYEGLPDVLRNYGTLTRSQFVKIVKPILRVWFSFRPERVQDVIQLLLDDKQRKYLDEPPSDTEVEIENLDINAPTDDETETPDNDNEVVTSVSMAKCG